MKLIRVSNRIRLTTISYLKPHFKINPNQMNCSEIWMVFKVSFLRDHSQHPLKYFPIISFRTN